MHYSCPNPSLLPPLFLLIHTPTTIQGHTLSTLAPCPLHPPKVNRQRAACTLPYSLSLQFGSLLNIQMIWDGNNQPSGSAYVLYEKREQAEAAINALSTRLTLPGMAKAMEVRFASEARAPPAGQAPQAAAAAPASAGATPPVSEGNLIFFSGGPPGVGEPEVEGLFSQYGKASSMLASGCAWLCAGCWNLWGCWAV
jgi:hypothetical protein